MENNIEEKLLLTVENGLMENDEPKKENFENHNHTYDDDLNRKLCKVEMKELEDIEKKCKALNKTKIFK
jgi:hypothetical protein